MSKIKIEVGDIRSIAPHLKQDSSKISILQSRIFSLRGSLDSRILSRRNISWKLNKAGSSLDSIELKMRMLDSFINQSMDRYSDAEKQILRNGKEPVKVKNKKEPSDLWEYFKANFWEATKASMGGYAFFAAAKHLLKLADNVEFKLFKDNGRTFIKLVNEGYQPSNYMAIRNLLMEKMGGEAGDWKKSYVNRLVNKGIALYDSMNDEVNNNAAFRQARHKFSNTNLSDLNKYVQRIGENRVKVWGKTFGESVVENTKALWDDFNYKGFIGTASNVKISKTLGVVGTMIMVGENAKTAIEEKSLKTFVVHTSVDVTYGVGSVAMGAAFGSLIIPPVGTIVGAAAGAGINLALNWKFDALGKKSITDVSKEFVDDSVSKIGDSVSKIGDSIGDSVSSIGNKIGGIFG